jgi:hypothetical protein
MILDEVEDKEQYCVEISDGFAALQSLNTEVDINDAWEAIRENTEISVKGSVICYGMKKHKPWFSEGCSKLLDQRKQAKLQWLQVPSKNKNKKKDDLKNVRNT